jgi:hypothetical protein
MNVAEVSRKLSEAGRENAIEVVPTFKTVSMDELAEKPSVMNSQTLSKLPL